MRGDGDASRKEPNNIRSRYPPLAEDVYFQSTPGREDAATAGGVEAERSRDDARARQDRDGQRVSLATINLIERRNARIRQRA